MANLIFVFSNESKIPAKLERVERIVNSISPCFSKG
jgi:hypothetical protein